MKRNLHLLLLFFIASFGLTAQLTVTTGQVFEASGTTADSSVKIDVNVDAGTTAVGEFFWELVRSETMSEEWLFSVCDVNTCYAPGIEICPTTKPNTLDPGQSLKFNFYLNPNAVAGLDIVKMRLFPKGSPETTLVEVDMTYEIAVASSVDDGEFNESINLYPNPTTDYFSIENDGNVSQVAVYSIVGREMFSYTHEAGQAYSVSDLNNGFYMARLIDDSGQTLKIIRFNKK